MPAQAETTFLAANVSDLSFHVSRIGEGVDIAEICGGEGRSSVMAVRRRLRAGRNFDIITGTDLRDPAEVTALWRYLRAARQFVVVMAPICQPFGSLAHLN